MTDLGSTWVHRRPKIEIIVIGLALVIAGLLGQAVTNRGGEVLAWLGLPFGALLVLIQPVLGMLSIAATATLERLAMIGEEVTFTRALGMAVFGLWLSRKFVRRESWRPILSPSLVKANMCLLVLILASVLWALDPSLALVGVLSQLSMFLWSLLVSDLASSWHRIAWLAKVLVMAALVAAILTIEQHLVGGARRAGGNIAGGVNATAYTLVTIIPFAFYLIRAKEGRVWRSVGLLYLLLAVVAVGVTLSRTSYLMLLLVMLVEYWETGRERIRRSWLVAVTGVVAIAFMLSPLDLISERAQTIVPYAWSAITGEVEEEHYIGGRGLTYRVGFAMFRDHPLTGIGYASFGRAYGEYKYYVPDAAPFAYLSSHSSYLSFLAELGLPGLLLWSIVLGIVLHNLTMAWSALSRTGASMQLCLVRAVTYSFALHLGYGWSIQVHGEKIFWLLLGLSVALRRLAEQSDRLHKSADASSTTIPLSASGVKP